MSRQIRNSEDSLGASLAAHAAFHEQTLIISRQVAEWLQPDDAHRAFAFHMTGEPDAYEPSGNSVMAGSFDGFMYSSHRDTRGNGFWLVTELRHAVTAFLTRNEMERLFD